MLNLISRMFSQAAHTVQRNTAASEDEVLRDCADIYEKIGELEEAQAQALPVEASKKQELILLAKLKVYKRVKELGEFAEEMNAARPEDRGAIADRFFAAHDRAIKADFENLRQHPEKNVNPSQFEGGTPPTMQQTPPSNPAPACDTTMLVLLRFRWFWGLFLLYVIGACLTSQTWSWESAAASFVVSALMVAFLSYVSGRIHRTGLTKLGQAAYPIRLSSRDLQLQLLLGFLVILACQGLEFAFRLAHLNALVPWWAGVPVMLVFFAAIPVLGLTVLLRLDVPS